MHSYQLLVNPQSAIGELLDSNKKVGSIIRLKVNFSFDYLSKITYPNFPFPLTSFKICRKDQVNLP